MKYNLYTIQQTHTIFSNISIWYLNTRKTTQLTLHTKRTKLSYLFICLSDNLFICYKQISYFNNDANNLDFTDCKCFPFRTLQLTPHALKSNFKPLISFSAQVNSLFPIFCFVFKIIFMMFCLNII